MFSYINLQVSHSWVNMYAKVAQSDVVNYTQLLGLLDQVHMSQQPYSVFACAAIDT